MVVLVREGFVIETSPRLPAFGYLQDVKTAVSVYATTYANPGGCVGKRNRVIDEARATM